MPILLQISSSMFFTTYFFKRSVVLCFCIMITLSVVNGQSTWEVDARDIDPSNYYGVTVANGMIGIVSSPEPLHVSDVVLNGVYDYYQRGRVSNILKGFNHVNMDLDIDGHRIGMSNVHDYKQTLDMKNARLITSFSTDKVTVEHEIMALRHLPYTALVNITITNGDNAVEITPIAKIEAPNHLNDVRNTYAEIDRPHVLIPLMTSTGKSPSGKQTVAASVSFIFEEQHGSEPDLIHEDWDYNMHLTKFRKTLAPGESYSFSLVASTCASAHYEDPMNEAERLTIFAALEGKERLISRHRQAWDKLWSTGDIIVEGNDDVTRDIRFALYHLYSFARKGTAYSLSPMGLSGLGYNGHVFWDTELWMYPPLLILQPEIAESLLKYRFERLGAARQNAFSHGFEGAMFPWESADDGSEDTPVWALTGPFQHHITGCIAWAHWKYYQVTGNKQWLKDRGWPVIKAAAQFWASRVELNDDGKYDIKNVIGANEWQENIDNNAFTNGMAITSLNYAVQAAAELGLSPDPDWSRIAENIPILKFEDGTTRENATYDGEMIKQADVNLLAYPLGYITDENQIQKDMDYYAPKMAPDGPAMGTAILSILYNQLGNTERAAELFTKSYMPNKVPPFGVLSETAGGTNPYFATGAGGMLQAVLAGFGGLRISDSGIDQIKTGLPEGWEKLTIIGAGTDDRTYTVE
jgi:kojibiose hydrolase